MQRIADVALVVPDYDEAIDFYVNRLGFTLVSDIDLGGRKRWVRVRPEDDDSGTCLLLAQAVDELQKAAIGNQTGGRVGFFLQTDDFASDYTRLKDNGVQFLEAPRHEDYGSVAVFSDPWGNKWDLIEPRPEA
ncbi:MAG: VOC family protein [Pseudomonadota bacterium]